MDFALFSPNPRVPINYQNQSSTWTTYYCTFDYKLKMKRLLGSLRSGISSHKSKFSNQSIYLPHFFNNIRSVSTQSTIFSSLKNNETMDPSSELKEDTTTTPSINNSNDENPNVAFDETVSQPATKSEEKTKIDSTNKVNTIASTMTTTRDFRIKSIQSELVSSHNSGKVSRIFELLEVVRNEGIRLNTKSYMIFLWACTRVTGSRANQAYWAFGCLRKDGILPLDAFDKVLTVCANQADLRSAIDILKEFK